MPNTIKHVENLFSKRLFRDMRNTLAKQLIHSLETDDWQHLSPLFTQYHELELDPDLQEDLATREKKYKKVLQEKKNQGISGIFPITALLWDNGLFFEVHEYLEPLWKKESGHKKELLQAFIRAAGTYVHIQQGNISGASKMAQKAEIILEKYRDLIPVSINTKLLLEKLKHIDSKPPTLRKHS